MKYFKTRRAQTQFLTNPRDCSLFPGRGLLGVFNSMYNGGSLFTDYGREKVQDIYTNTATEKFAS